MEKSPQVMNPVEKGAWLLFSAASCFLEFWNSSC